MEVIGLPLSLVEEMVAPFLPFFDFIPTFAARIESV